MMNADDDAQLDDNQLFGDRDHANKINDAFGLAKGIQKPLNFPSFASPPPSSAQNPLLTNFKPDNINFFNISPPTNLQKTVAPISEPPKLLTGLNDFRARSEPKSGVNVTTPVPPTIQNSFLLNSSPSLLTTSLEKKSNSVTPPSSTPSLTTPPLPPSAPISKSQTQTSPFKPVAAPLTVNYSLPPTLKAPQERVQILQPVAAPVSMPTPVTISTTPVTLNSTDSAASSTTPKQSSPAVMTPPIFTSVLPPPLATATPPPSVAANKTPSNPYSARGALNKKIYEPVVASVPLAPISVQQIASVPSEPVVPSNIYVPPPMAATPTAASVDQSTPAPLTTSQQPFYTPQVAVPTSYIPPNLSYPDIQRDLAQPSPNLIMPTATTENGYHEPYSQSQQQQQHGRAPQRNVWNRLVSSLKTGVESVLTTMDPQIKDYMQSMNEHLNVLNASGDKTLTDVIRTAFSQAGFLRMTIIDYDSKPQTQYAPQIVGYPCVQHCLNEKLLNSEQYIQQKCLMIAIQPFLVELNQDCWFDQICIMLKDTQHNIDVTVYTEAIPVQLDYVNQLKQATSDDYPLKWSGFTMRLNENTPQLEWYESLYGGVQQKTLISNSLKTLAFIFKHKFMNQQS